MIIIKPGRGCAKTHHEPFTCSHGWLLFFLLFSSLHSLPILSSLLGGGDDDASQTIASRLSKKLGYMVFASCSVPVDDDTMIPIASMEKRLLEYIRSQNQ